MRGPRHQLLPGAVLALALLGGAADLPHAAASGPMPPPPAYELYSKASVVILGRVQAVAARTVRVRVLETLKGTPPLGEAGTVTVGPIFEEECGSDPKAERASMYRVGGRILGLEHEVLPR